ncbi:MAG: cysteine desulfurase-like protein [Planctomycetota bacterium]
MLTAALVQHLRRLFPALAKIVNGKPAVYLDGPAGTQVPQSVIQAITHCLSTCNANHGGLFATSREGDALVDQAHQALADFVGADDPGEIAFGANMTSLTFAFSRSLARTWSAGDEVLVTRLDHDANFTPWALAARDAGATLRVVDIRREDGTLDLDDLRSKLSHRTKMVAVGVASNSLGTVNPVAQIAQWAHDVNALVFLDDVHAAPHRLTDVRAWGCDFLACSAYKFFGPHVGVLWGRRHLLESLEAYKVRPATNELPGKWMTGTQNHACVIGTLAAVDYLADIGRIVGNKPEAPRRAALESAFASISAHERSLGERLLAGLADMPKITVYGITDPKRFDERVATFSFTHADRSAAEVAQTLGEHGVFAWHGNYYALNLSESLGREPQGMVRVGVVHYNTEAEVDRLITVLRDHCR